MQTSSPVLYCICCLFNCVHNILCYYTLSHAFLHNTIFISSTLISTFLHGKKMTLSEMFVILFLSIILHLSTCVAVVDVEYSFKYSYEGQSDHEGDLFGASLSTFNHKLVVGAPGYNDFQGSITVMPDGLQVRGPEDGKDFGGSVDMNQEFIVVSGHPDVFVYKSSSPYNLVAKFPSCGLNDQELGAVVISDDNPIFISHVDENYDKWLSIYKYDGSATWHRDEKFDLESTSGPHDSPSLSVHGDSLVVGLPTADHDEQGQVRVYNRVHGKWVEGQTIKQDGVQLFGWSVAIYGQHMAVSDGYGHVFTFMFDDHTKTWVDNGRISVPNNIFSFLYLDKDMLAITVNNKGKYPDLCGVVYRLSTATATRTTTNNSSSNNGNVVWEEIARLTTKGDPITDEDQLHFDISVEEKVAFISRWKYGEGVGKVFVHDLTNINN